VGRAALPAGHDSIRLVRQVVKFFRRNPQVFVLLIICLVLGIGTFLAVLISLIGSGSTQVSGEPSGAILMAPRPAASVLTANGVRLSVVRV
jgi:hypothetical protein